MESRPERPLADPLLTETHTDPVAVQNVCLPLFLAHHLKYENLPTSCSLMPPGSLLDASARRRASRRICVGVGRKAGLHCSASSGIAQNKSSLSECENTRGNSYGA